MKLSLYLIELGSKYANRMLFDSSTRSLCTAKEFPNPPRQLATDRYKAGILI